MESSLSTAAIVELHPMVSIDRGGEPSTPPAPNNTDEAHDALATDPEQYPTGLRFVFVTLGLVLSIFLAALDSNILSTAIPKITDQFGAVKDVGWYSAGYSITNTAFSTSWGRAYKFFPLKWTFVAAVGFFELGNIICATAQSSPFLILGRLVAGVGGSGIFTGCFIIIAMSAKPQYRPAYMGVLGVTFGCASVAGPLLGGFLTDGPGWRWCFWINLPIGAFATTIMTLSFRTPNAARPAPRPLKEKLVSLDLAGASLILGSLTCLEVAFERAGIVSSWSNWRVVLSLIASAALAAVFILNERYMGDRAMIQGHLLKKRHITSNLIYQFFLAGLFFPLSYTLPLQFQSVDGASAVQSGVRLIPLILGVCVFTMVANGLLTFWKPFTPLLVAGAVLGTAGLALVHTLGADARAASWIGYEILIALGVGLTLQVPMIANQAAVGIADVAAVTSLTLLVENLGTAVFIAATTAAFSNSLVGSLAANAPGVAPQLVLSTGATSIRTVFAPDDVRGVLDAYLQGCKDSQFVPMACGASAILVSMSVAVPAAKKQLDSRVRKRT